MTDDIVRYYLDVLRFPVEQLFAVDSYDHGVPHLLPRSQQALFDQSRRCEDRINSSTLELCALREAVRQLPQLRTKPYVFKLTCKYKLPGLARLRPTQPLVVQHQREMHGQNTELWGVRGALLARLVSDLGRVAVSCMEPGDDPAWFGMEERFKCLLDEHRRWRAHQRLRPLENLARYKRGNGDVLLRL